jgi:hypothetical protein
MLTVEAIGRIALGCISVSVAAEWTVVPKRRCVRPYRQGLGLRAVAQASIGHGTAVSHRCYAVMVDDSGESDRAGAKASVTDHVVLVVEHEVLLRSTTAEFLRLLGFTVTDGLILYETVQKNSSQ